MKKSRIALILMGIIALMACQNSAQKKNKDTMQVSEKIVAQYQGANVKEYILINQNGMEIRIINYGGIVTYLTAKDKNGIYEDVVLGFDQAEKYWTEPYASNCCYLGAIVGRYGNRIAKGEFELNDTSYSLATNNGPNHLHGGLVGFDKVVWESESFKKEKSCGVKLRYLSKDGEEGYPGNFSIEVVYSLTDQDELRIDYTGSIDQACPVNVTHHGYFNLTGGSNSNILDHELVIHADRYTVVDETLIPTGELRQVAKTPMDFNKAHKIGERIAEVEGGYDHNYVLSDDVLPLRKVIRVKEPASGRIMDVLTTEPGVQFYSGNFLNGILMGKNNVAYNKHWGFCLETQHYPDSPNQDDFPSTTLNPGETYSHTTIYQFKAEQ